MEVVFSSDENSPSPKHPLIVESERQLNHGNPLIHNFFTYKHIIIVHYILLNLDKLPQQ